MFFKRRSLRVLILVAVSLVALDEDARTMTSGFLTESYFLMAGRDVPLPLERPPFLAQAALGDCLFGNGYVDEDDAYGAFCTDLMTFANPHETAPAAKDETVDLAMASPARGLMQAEREIPTPLALRNEDIMRPDSTHDSTSCIVDADGATRIRTLGVWTHSPATTKDANRKPNHIAPVPFNCQIESPIDGTVLYAGNFKGYFGVIILDGGRASQVTLAGLGTIAVGRGDKVKRGTTLGSSAGRVAPALASAAAGMTEAVLLYVTEPSAAAGPAS